MADDPPESPPKRTDRPKVKRPRAGLVGPLFRWELVRLARRGQDARARFILAGSLLFVLTAFALIWFRHVPVEDLFFGGSQQLTIAESSTFANQFALTFLLAQMGVLALLTPAYAAGSISEEKENKTFIYLLVSDLTSREILFGKFLGRLTFVLGVMLAGLPILALTMLFGGVSLTLLLTGYIVTFATVVMVTAISVASACATETYRGALFRSYGLTALLVFLGAGLPFISPFAILIYLNLIGDNSIFWSLVLGVGYSSIELIVALICVVLATQWVRKMRARPLDRTPRDRDYRHRDRDDRRRPSRDDDWQPKSLQKPPAAFKVLDVLAPEDLVPIDPEGEPVVRAKAIPIAKVEAKRPPPPPPPRRRDRRPPPVPDHVRRRPRVDADDPFLWKEVHTTGYKRTADDDSIRGLFVGIGLSAGLTVAFMLLIALLSLLTDSGSGNGTRVASKLLLTGGVAGFFTYLLAIGSGAAGTVVRERARQTLESLLTIPIDRRKILFPKWLVSMRKGWWWGVPVSLTLAVGVLLSDVPFAGLFCIVFVLAAIPFSASYGIWLSVRCSTVTRGVLWFLPVGAALAFFPVVLLMLFDVRTENQAAIAMAAAAGLVALTAWVLWLLAAVRFEREGRN